MMITTIEIRGDSVATAIIIPKKTKKGFVDIILYTSFHKYII